MVTSAVPLPVMEAGLKLHVLSLPEGEIVHDDRAKLIVPVYPFSAVTISGMLGEFAPADEIVTGCGLLSEKSAGPEPVPTAKSVALLMAYTVPSTPMTVGV